MSLDYITNIKALDIFKDMDFNYSECNSTTSVFESDSNIHPYPAKLVPNLVHDLLKKFSEIKDINLVLDPFVGSGTVALESKVLGFDFYGSDLNPLAVLLAKTKSLTIDDTSYIKKRLIDFAEILIQNENNGHLYTIINFININYWFKKENITQLSYLKHSIDAFLKKTSTKYKETFGLVLLTAFSATIRESSLTRNDEFKLYRISPKDIEEFKIDSVRAFKNNVNNLLKMIKEVNFAFKKTTKSNICLCNAKDLKYLENKKVSIVLTSPPYGDSRSTVSYGQFSRLSLQWTSDLIKKYIGIDVPNDNCDEYLLGGKYSKQTEFDSIRQETIMKSNTLSELMRDIDEITSVELANLQVGRKVLEIIANDLQDNKINISVIEKNRLLSSLIKERIRLYIFRAINKQGKFDTKRVKKLAQIYTENFIKDLTFGKPKKRFRKIIVLKRIICFVNDTILRKINSLPRRKKEVQKFFVDLYEVVVQTDKVIEDDGIQAWVVGHRTVLGCIKVKMADILLEWFDALGYKRVALIDRKYHYKRLPHHINSTFTRSKEIKTMEQEHILIVRKHIQIN